MFPAEVPFDASAVVVWLPQGMTPTAADFHPNNVQPPPTAYWFLHEAVVDVAQAQPSDGKVPWIKYGSTILDEAAIRTLFPEAKKITNADGVL